MSRWLSRIVLARAPSSYELHRVLWGAFEASSERPFLFRADPLDARRLAVLVLSTARPVWTELGDRLIEASGPKSHDPPIESGTRLRFLLRANTTVSRKGRAEPRFAGLDRDAFRKADGRRVALVREDDRIAWLVRKGDDGGFRVATRDDGAPLLRVSAPFAVSWRRDGRVARHDGVDFEGVLVVERPDDFATTLARGIGPAKAFGFGLLSVAPA